MTPGEHKPHLMALGVTTPAIESLDAYLGLVATWNLRTNLTAARTAEERVSILVEPPSQAAGLLPGGRFIDVGSGNGSPGVILAILRRDLEPVTLLEPRARRWAFLREATRLVGRADIRVFRGRCEEFNELAEVITMRAVGLDPDVAGRLLMPGGHLFVFGGAPGATKTLAVLPKQHVDNSELHHFQKPIR